MNILIVHNQYQQQGGEDTVVLSEIDLLQKHGNKVLLFSKDNSEIVNLSNLELVKQTFWSQKSKEELRGVLMDFDADIIHVHNTFPLISPSIYWLADELKIPIIQTLHNFRLFCPQAMFLRNGKICENCMGKVPWKAVLHRCYRNSILQTGVLSSMLVFHRLIGTWTNKVDKYIALNQFCRNKFIEGGLPDSKVCIKPNFISSPIRPDIQARKDFLFVGRLSQEKGIKVLAQAAQKNVNINFYVAGKGDEKYRVTEVENITVLGSLTKDKVREKMLQARALVVPSLWYENFPMTIVEAYAAGLPVIASNIGALKEIVIDGETGMLFKAGCAEDLAQKIQWAEENPEKFLEMGRNARAFYEKKLSPEINYKILMSIYNSAIQKKGNTGE